MRFLLLLCLLPTLVSCEISHYKALNETYHNGQLVSRRLVEEPLAQFGGERTTHRSDGSSTTNNYQATAQHFFQFLTALSAAYASGVASQAVQVTQQMKDAGLTKQQMAAIDAQAKLDALKYTPTKVAPGESVYTPATGLSSAPVQ